MPLLGLLAGGIPWRLVAVIGLMAGLAIGAITIAGQLKKVGRLESELAIAAGAAKINAQTVKIERAEYDRREQIAGRRDALLAKIRANHATVRKEIASAPASDDGPLAPILRRQLERMRQQAGNSGTPGAAAAGGGAGTPAGAVP